MIDIETYRCRIGGHYLRLTNNKTNGHKTTTKISYNPPKYPEPLPVSQLLHLFLAGSGVFLYVLIIFLCFLGLSSQSSSINLGHCPPPSAESGRFMKPLIYPLYLALQMAYFSFITSSGGSTSNISSKRNDMKYPKHCYFLKLLVMTLVLLFFLASCALLLIVIINPSITNPGPKQSINLNSLKVVYCNIQGLVHMNSMTSKTPTFQANKLSDLRAYLYTYTPDIVILNETWLSKYISDNEVVLDKYYTVYRKDRTVGDKEYYNKKGGGGVMILCKNNAGFKVSLYKGNSGDLPILSVLVKAKNGHKLCISTYYRYDYSKCEHADSVEEYYLELIKRYSNIAIIGDLNLSSVKDWDVPVTSNSSHSRFLEIFDNLGLTCLINNPTHQSGNILDLILTNQPEIFRNLAIQPNFLTSSDHFTLTADISLIKKPKSVTKVRKFCYKKADWNSINNELRKIDWGSIFRNRTIKEKLDIFKSKLDIILRKHIPMVLVKVGDKPPWYDSELKNLKNRLDRARKAANNPSSDPVLREFFLKLEVSYREMVKNKMASYFTDEGPGNTVSKKLYKHIGSLSNSTRIPDVLHNENITSTKSEDKCNMFNSFFSQQFSDSSDYRTHVNYNRNNPSDCNNTYFMESDVFKVLKNLDPSKACGPDNIEGIVLKKCRFSLSKPLSLLFNSCFHAGDIPAEWKDANVVPIHKKSAKNDVRNYRPISLTCLVMKVFENLVRDKLYSHCKDKITIHQHGFVPHKSCNTQLIEFSSQLAYNLNNHLQTDIVYFDFSKAFDSVSHDLILEKLKNQFDIDGKLLNFLKIYLQNRRQRVMLDGTFSDWTPVTSGVPQGSILGPLLFVLFINDIVDSVGDGTHIKLYADDLKIWREIRCQNDSLQVDIDNLEAWSTANNMKFHPSKCKVIRSTCKHDIIHRM